MHRLFSTSELTNTNTPHTHWHTLSVNPERWSKRSSRSAHSPWEGCETVNCLHNLALFFFTSFFFLMHLCFPSARLSITRRLRGAWKAGRFFFFFSRPSLRRTSALTYLNQCVIHLSWHTLLEVCAVIIHTSSVPWTRISHLGCVTYLTSYDILQLFVVLDWCIQGGKVLKWMRG